MNYVGCCLVVSGRRSAKAFRMDSCHCILVWTSRVLSRPPTAAQQSADRTKRARQSSAPRKGASLSAVCTSSVSTPAPGSTLQQTAHAAPQQIPCATLFQARFLRIACTCRTQALLCAQRCRASTSPRGEPKRPSMVRVSTAAVKTTLKGQPPPAAARARLRARPPRRRGRRPALRARGAAGSPRRAARSALVALGVERRPLPLRADARPSSAAAPRAAARARLCRTSRSAGRSRQAQPPGAAADSSCAACRCRDAPRYAEQLCATGDTATQMKPGAGPARRPAPGACRPAVRVAREAQQQGSGGRAVLG